MMSANFKAGAGRAEINFPADMFPTDNLYGVHDAPCARLLVLENGEKVAIASLELVNAPEDCVDSLRKIIEEITGTPYKNVWIHVTHAITTPHAPGGPMGGKPGKMKPPPGMKIDPDAPRKRKSFIDAIEKAMREAATQAAESFGDACYGIGTGDCDVNVNRDVETPFGWWVAQNPAELSNKKMTILRVERPNGKPLAFLISYGIKPCAIDQSELDSPERKVSADVPGVACRMMEERFGAPCLFCMSAAGDQVPREQSFYETVLEDGSVGKVDMGVKAGYEIVERLGKEMGGNAIDIAYLISCNENGSTISTASGTVLCQTRENKPGPMLPRKELEYKKEGLVSLGAEIIQFGDVAFVAVKPEVNTRTELELQENSPYKHTLLVSMVNGGMKYMPDQSAYDRVTWEAQRAMLMPGSAEKWVARVSDMLTSMSECKTEPVITAVAEPYPDGQRITKVYVDFEDEIPDFEAISVVGRTVTERKMEGRRVILHLCPDDKDATVIPGFEGGPGGPGGSGGPEGPGGPGKRRVIPGKKRKPIVVEVNVPGFGAPIASGKVIQPVVDAFIPGEYKRVLYNLYIPKDYDPGKKYPLVMFIPDASANGDDPLLALAQGIGGTCWVEREEQKKHPCFVLAVQIPSGIMLTNDAYEVSPEFEDIKELLDKTIKEYSIDCSRIYTTGQSQGCMASCEMNVRYPELFAASMLVAGHWDVEKMSKLTHCKFFFGLSEGGLKEYPNFNTITDAFEKQGVKVARQRLNFRDGWEVNNAKIRKAAEGAQMVYAIFDKATAFPDDGKIRPDIAHHARGWELAYQLEAARDWLFAQHK